MELASSRVKSIYSAIASPNRLEVLKILNAKGPLSYSGLKTFAGFKSKKESGKFAYHLRKLVKQGLISLNRTERKYSVSNFGRLILNHTRQIEEQSLLKSGKFYVRTSRQTIEEFNPDKILQSLIREAGMPSDLAQRITSEVETRISKFQTSYLTAPLIREMVNALLIEHGSEDYRHKLTRVGLPVYDVKELMNKAGRMKESIESILDQTSKAVLSEYFLLTQIPRDVADAHLSGEINLPNLGYCGLMPDGIFVNLSSMYNNEINLDGRLMSFPRVHLPSDLEESLERLTLLTSLLSREIASEICYENFLDYISKYSKRISQAELTKSIGKTFLMMSLVSMHTHSRPEISINLHPKASGKSFELILATFDAYKRYLESTPIPQIKFVVFLCGSLGKEVAKLVSSTIELGGCFSISTQPDLIRSFSGLEKNVPSIEYKENSFSVIRPLSLNLPRLSYESSKDETYFRTKLAMLLQLSQSAISNRRKILSEAMMAGLLPVLTQNPSIISSDYVSPIVNLVGLNEAISNLTNEKTTPSEKRALAEKIVATAKKFIVEKAEKTEEKVGLSILHDDSSERFLTLDIERYGKAVVVQKERGYLQAPHVKESDLLNDDLMKELNWLSDNLNGGFSVIVDMQTKPHDKTTEDIVSSASTKLRFFNLNRQVILCKNCGGKSLIEVSRCKFCRSASLTSYNTSRYV